MMAHRHFAKYMCNRHTSRLPVMCRRHSMQSASFSPRPTDMLHEEADGASTSTTTPFYPPSAEGGGRESMTPFVSPNQAAALAAVELKRAQVLKKSKWTKTRQTRREVPKLTSKMIASYPSVTFRIRRIKGSWKKVFPISRFVIGMSAREASDQLGVLPHKYARVMRDFLKSSMLNCENVHGMNADRLLITECSVGRGRMVPRLRIHARGRHGIQHKQFSNVRMKLVEVPPIEGERKLGRWGWNNKTWESYHEMAEELPMKFPHLFPAKKTETEETDATEASGVPPERSMSDLRKSAASAAAASEVADLGNMSDADLEKHFKDAMASAGDHKYTDEEIAEVERSLRAPTGATEQSNEEEAEIAEVTEKVEEAEVEEAVTENVEAGSANEKKQE